uniref:Calpain catalytic domain-containing protein n=1 Tax=Globodera pallida TaxID=36090 RepID=A0A183BLA1_GLOPA
MEELNKFALSAVEYDRLGQTEEAIFYYKKAAHCTICLIESGKLSETYKQAVEKYLLRAQLLMHNNGVNETPHNSLSDIILKAQKMIDTALGQDELGEEEEAVRLYAETAEFCIEKSKLNDENSVKMRSLAFLALDRAEALKNKLAGKGTEQFLFAGPSAPNLTDEDEDNNNTMCLLTLHSSDGPSPSNAGRIVANASPQPAGKTRRRWSEVRDGGSRKAVEKLEEGEVRVLFATSRINTRTYVPFIKECDLKEPFALSIPFSDKDGFLPLSEKQKKVLKGWLRPDEFMADPKVIVRIDSGTIKQTIITDCSFVASLAVCARFENRFGTRLITNIIYPQNKKGDPIHNPCGKYMVKLHINGIWRKVIIDDLLPLGNNGELLCSHSQNKNELWVSLLEKAYMKVMGGYDFPGSNSSIDLNALTGWIPERIPIRPKESVFDADKTFERLFLHFHQGHCLITLATGKIDEAERERTGLVDAHAYAVLDLRKGKRLFLLKNPWTNLRWKGRFSEKDVTSWTPEMCAKLDYNPKDAQQFDDGIFWIDYPSICAFFDVFYVNWSPALFPFRHALHSSWDAGKGPVKDLYTVGENPQYFLELNNRHGTASVWILLSRHITEKDDFANNCEYITVMVYKNDGKRVYLPFDPKPLLEGTRINSPHYLCQLIIREPGVQRFTLVIAQYEKMKTIYYSLRIYSSVEFRCGPIQVPYKFHKKETAEWRGPTAGGCGNGTSRETFQNNPLFHLSLEDGSDDNAILVELRGPKEYSVGFEVALVFPIRTGRTFERHDSGPFRPGFTALQLEGLPAGTFSIRPMTFVAGQEGPFILRVDCSCNFELKRVQ